MNVYDVVNEFEKRMAEYAGAPYGVAVNSCTNAIALSLMYENIIGQIKSTDDIELPKHTYVGVAHAIINNGHYIKWMDYQWIGLYRLWPSRIVDSARWLTSDMYEPGTFLCLSFHESKQLPVGDGGMILTDDKNAYDYLRQMRFDGRTPGKSVFDDEFALPSMHCHQKPDVAARGLMLMAGLKEHNKPIPGEYPDISQFEYFRRHTA
jgi:dTDP-4-amino-4,6-dideoxygalactose transaminase